MATPRRKHSSKTDKDQDPGRGGAGGRKATANHEVETDAQHGAKRNKEVQRVCPVFSEHNSAEAWQSSLVEREGTKPGQG